MRITRDEYGITLAGVCALRSTCIRRAVGCVITDKDGVILSTGYNGVPTGFDHCNEGNPCPGATAASGEALGACQAIHAEQNAILFLPDPRKAFTIYTTTYPCIHCMKILLNTSTQRILYAEDYVQPEAREMWTRAGRTSEQINV